MKATVKDAGNVRVIDLRGKMTLGKVPSKKPASSTSWRARSASVRVATGRG